MRRIVKPPVDESKALKTQGEIKNPELKRRLDDAIFLTMGRPGLNRFIRSLNAWAERTGELTPKQAHALRRVMKFYKARDLPSRTTGLSGERTFRRG